MNDLISQPVYVKAEIITKRFVPCPLCKKHNFSVEHCIEGAKPNAPYMVGPWQCDNCHASFAFKIYTDGTADMLQVETKDPFIPSLVLLKSQHKNSPIFLMLETRNHKSSLDKEKAEPFSSHLDYFYNSGTCPTNWTNDISAIYFDGESDPHGVFEFQRVINLEDAKIYRDANPHLFTNPNDRGKETEWCEYIAELFPEVLELPAEAIDGIVESDTLEITTTVNNTIKLLDGK